MEAPTKEEQEEMARMMSDYLNSAIDRYFEDSEHFTDWLKEGGAASIISRAVNIIRHERRRR